MELSVAGREGHAGQKKHSVSEGGHRVSIGRKIMKT